jgi:hypothetical protein
MKKEIHQIFLEEMHLKNTCYEITNKMKLIKAKKRLYIYCFEEVTKIESNIIKKTH